MTHDRILSIFARRRHSWNQHDAANLAADYTEDAVLTSPYVGRVVGHLAVGNNLVAQFFSIAGTHSGEFMGMPPNGRRFECHIASRFTMRGDRICFERRVYDFSGLLIQIGVLKAKPA